MLRLLPWTQKVSQANITLTLVDRSDKAICKPITMLGWRQGVLGQWGGNAKLEAALVHGIVKLFGVPMNSFGFLLRCVAIVV